MTTLIDLWLEAAHEAYALRAQLAHLEEAWLRAEADADFWYFHACNRNLREAPELSPQPRTRRQRQVP